MIGILKIVFNDMLKKLINIINKNVSILFIFLLFSTHFSFFPNLYKIYKRSYDERMLRVYGYDCDKFGYGFITNSKNYIKEKKFHILNFEQQELMKSLFTVYKKDQNKKNLILIKYDNQNLNNQNININEYELIYSNQRCFLYKKK